MIESTIMMTPHFFWAHRKTGSFWSTRSTNTTNQHFRLIICCNRSTITVLLSQ